MNKEDVASCLDTLQTLECLEQRDINALKIASSILEHMSNTDYEDLCNDHIRECTKCGNIMEEGYCIESGIEYYCSEECLHKEISEEEWQRLYDNGNGDSYWTTWY